MVLFSTTLVKTVLTTFSDLGLNVFLLSMITLDNNMDTTISTIPRPVKIIFRILLLFINVFQKTQSQIYSLTPF